MLTVHLIRHGQSQGNVRTDVIGGLDPEVQLTELGVFQAKQLHEWLKQQDQDILKIYVSSLDRAVHTANIATSHLDHEHHEDTRLVEGTHGEWEGQPRELFEQAKEDQEKLGEEWKAPGGESTVEVRKRMRDAFDELIEPYKNQDKHIYVFGHGGSLRCLVGDLLDIEGFLWKSTMDNTARIELQYDGVQWRMTKFNDTQHLKDFQK